MKFCLNPYVFVSTNRQTHGNSAYARFSTIWLLRIHSYNNCTIRSKTKIFMCKGFRYDINHPCGSRDSIRDELVVVATGVGLLTSSVVIQGKNGPLYSKRGCQTQYHHPSSTLLYSPDTAAEARLIKLHPTEIIMLAIGNYYSFIWLPVYYTDLHPTSELQALVSQR